MLKSWFGEERGDASSSARRSPEAQSKIDEATSKLALYHYETCWFSGKVRSTISALNLSVELRDIHVDRAHHQRLIAEGGSGTVPCLFIEKDDGSVQWLYESSDISSYLENRFATDL
jgi:glutathione S-transferase